MAATKKSKKSAAPKKSAAKKSVIAAKKAAARLAAPKKAKMGRPATYRYFTATVKFRLPVSCQTKVSILRGNLIERLDGRDGLKVTVSEDKK